VTDWHTEISLERTREAAFRVRVLREPSIARVFIIKEASGEIRARCVLPGRSKSSAKQALASGPQATGCRALVYSAKLGENPKTAAGLNPVSNERPQYETDIPTEGRPGAGILPRDSQLRPSGKRAIKNGVAMLEKRFGRRIVFGTITLPGSTGTASRAVAVWSAKIAELLRKWVAYTAPGSEWVYVWEWQTRGALHLHMAIGNNNVLALRKLERGWHQYVYKMWTTVSRLSGVDCFKRSGGGTWAGMAGALRSNCEPVRKSVKRYMAKYLSKGAQGRRCDPVTGEVSMVAAGEPACSPARWWGQSAAILAAARLARLCTVLETSDWDLAARAYQRLAETAATLGFQQFSYSALFAPYNLTTLLYPDALSEDPVYDYLTRILQASYISAVCP